MDRPSTVDRGTRRRVRSLFVYAYEREIAAHQTSEDHEKQENKAGSANRASTRACLFPGYPFLNELKLEQPRKLFRIDLGRLDLGLLSHLGKNPQISCRKIDIFRKDSGYWHSRCFLNWGARHLLPESLDLRFRRFSGRLPR